MDQGTQRLITRHNEQMRELIVRDIDALGNKLNVKRQVSSMADGAVDKVKGTLGMNNRNPNEGWGDFVRHNVAPLAAIGLGGTLLARNVRQRIDAQSTTTIRTFDPTHGTTVSGTSGAPTRTYDDSSDGGSSMGLKDRASSMMGDMQGTASEGIDTAREKVSDATTMVGEKAATAKDAVASQAVHAKDVVIERIPSRTEARRMAHDHSQALGVAALVAGAVAGAFVPRSRMEERKLAPMQSQMKDKASDLVESSVEKAKETADRAAEAVKSGAEAAKEEFSETGAESEDTSLTTSESESGLPDLTQPNRITGGTAGTSRPTTPSGMNGSGY